ncbi:hypothetical protein GOV05_04495 [Candidatus Woesearchaeota archaeon]|nr:hypothetical protein [Candidatus Woesearchaeota archaeon]
MWAGGIIVVLTLILTGANGLYTDYLSCKDVDSTFNKDEIISGTTVEDQMVYLEYLENKMSCSSVESNLFMSHLILIVGFAFVAGGYVTRK